ncbi:putative entry exclusion protein TrbK-alt [Sphingomonas sp. R647]|uniref:putative entry exclusion protein TrbK-alt n=1 Tax=Sphingomonas sp. R647 TaxID=2875233 RepID=UPI001CD23A19|nr:putative entry exclusion protein TrbK-alt [Sphingomonas sp. R647]MCA1200150.1 putative entry exclusion protein TrbK-alt [Sphingomonas sp. R647]
MSLKLPARIGACACLGIALAMAALALREPPRPGAPAAILSTDLPKNPLEAQLERCQLAGQAAGSDPGCLAAWAENRRRFLGLDPATEDEDRAAGKSTQAADLPDAALEQEDR